MPAIGDGGEEESAESFFLEKRQILDKSGNARVLMGGLPERRCVEIRLCSSGQPTIDINVTGGVRNSSGYSSIFTDSDSSLKLGMKNQKSCGLNPKSVYQIFQLLTIVEASISKGYIRSGNYLIFLIFFMVETRNISGFHRNKNQSTALSVTS